MLGRGVGHRVIGITPARNQAIAFHHETFDLTRAGGIVLVGLRHQQLELAIAGYELTVPGAESRAAEDAAVAQYNVSVSAMRVSPHY